MKKALCSFLMIAVCCTISLTRVQSQPDTLDLNNLMSKPNGNYKELMSPINSVINQTGTHSSEAEDYDAEVIQRWNWFWKNRLDGGNSSNPGGFDMAFNSLLGIIIQPICNTYINNGSNWSLIGPKQDVSNSTDGGMGLVNAVAHDLTNPSIIYIGTNASGLWKTTDGGQNWNCVTDAIRLPGLGIDDVRIDPNNHNIIYIATGIGAFYGGYGIGVLRSSDAGATWHSVNPLTFSPGNRKFSMRILVDPFSFNATLNYSMNVYALVENFVYKSTNGGSAFTAQPNSEIVTPPNGSIRYWRDIEMKPGDPNTLYISSDDRGINDGGSVMMKTIDGGNTWFPLNSAGSGALSDRISIGVCNDPVTQADNVWIVYTGAGTIPGNYVNVWIRKSTDGGNSWNTLFNGNVYQSYGNVLGGCGFYRQDLVIPDNDPNIIYVLGYFMNKSINGGSTFVQQTSGLHADIRAIDLVTSSPIGVPNGAQDHLLLGTDGGIASAQNGGGSWNYINGLGLAITQFYGLCSPESNKDIIASGAQDNGYFSYKKGAYTNDFKRILVGDAYDCVCDQSFATNQEMYGESNGGSYTLRATNTGGSDWSYPIGNIPSQVHSHVYPMVTNPINSNYYTAGHDVYTSPTPTIAFNNVVGGGSRLSEFSNSNPLYHVPSCNAISAIAVAPSDALTIYAAFDLPTWNVDVATCDLNCNPAGSPCVSCGSTSFCPLDKKIFVTHDGGTNWDDIGKFMNANIYAGSTDAVRWTSVTKIAIDPKNPNRVWMCFGGFWNISGVAINKVNYSPDGGNTWVDFTDGLPDFPANTIIYQKGSNDLLYVGTDVGVFYRDATMSQWECFTNNLPVCIITDLEINYCSQKIRASTFGRGLWESDLALSALPVTTQTWSTPTPITSDIDIQSAQTLTITSLVDIAKNRKIIVEPNATLDIAGGHLFNGCNEMWNRIELVDPTSTLRVHNGATIEDAYYGAYTQNGGVIEAENSTFDQNQVDIHIQGASGTYTGYVRNCTLENTTGLQQPFSPGTLSADAIQVANCDDVTIGDDALASYKNTIKDFTQCGIRVTDAGVTIINNAISSLVTVGIPRGVYATNITSIPYELNIGTRTGLINNSDSKNHFSNLNIGIWTLKNYVPNIADNEFEQIRSRGIYLIQCLHSINIISLSSPNGNYFHNCPNIGYGIELVGNPNAYTINVISNTLDLNNNAIGIYDAEYSCKDIPQTVIAANNISNIRQGIWVLNEGVPDIFSNHVVFTSVPYNSQVGYGINVQNCCVPDIENNTVESTFGPAKQVGGINAELCERPYICNNITRYLEKGIICRGPMLGTKVKLNIMERNFYGFTLENSGDIGDQGALPNLVSDNQWINNVFFDSYSVTSSNISNSVFYVQSGGNYSINSAYHDASSTYVLSSILNPYVPADCETHDGWRPAEQAEAAIQDTVITDSLLSDEERWIKKKQIFNLIKGDSAIDSSSLATIENFKAEIEPQPIGEFRAIENHIADAYGDTLAINANQSKLDSAETKNNDVVTSSLIELYKKIVNEIYLSTVARDNLNFTSDQINWLYAIAPLCPFEAGQAVYQARMLVTFINDSISFNDELCDSTAHMRISNHQAGLKDLSYFEIYPNPAKDVLNIDYIQPNNTVSELVLSEISGKEIRRVELKGMTNQKSISCSKLSSGIYFYKIYSNGSLAKTGKLVIHR